MKSYLCGIEKNQDIMKDRIAHIMRAKNLKASDFASLLGIQPSAISHILAGRNRPSLELVKKIKETFPEYNLDWIVFGVGPMTSSESSKEAFQEAQASIQMIHETSDTLPLSPDPIFADDSDIDTPAPSTIPPSTQSVILLYDDGTFESFRPR